MARAGRVMLVAISIPVGLLLILFGVLLVFSAGKPRPFVDENGKVLTGSISEKIHVNINGVQQGMFIKSRDTSNPVLLFLHGGAGMPEYFLTQRYPTGLEQYLTVCWWDRRGAGLSYRPNIPIETMTIEQLISDTLEVTNYLRNRFHKEKIFLMAHSGGSLIGIQAVARAPELYYAYVGVAQMAYQLKSENLAYEYMLERYREIGNIKMVRQLEAAPVTMTPPLPASYMLVRDKAMHGLGVGTTRDMKSVITGVFLASWLFPEYTLSEKMSLWRGKFLSDKVLLDKMIATDLTKQVVELEVPIYFFHGKYDYTVSYPQTKSYFKELKAPLKGFYTFEQSAHSPMFEEPVKMQQIIENDVLAGTNSLADEK
jgi:pimeloyl-ACP methyl ester carboxylesterase